jgi:tetratricopeptide (TPR) repeat protein
MPRAPLALMLALAAGCFVDNRLLPTQGLSRQQVAERRAATDLYPTALAQPGPAHPGPVRALRVRVWADASYRRRLHWRERAGALFERANRFLRHAVAVELVADLRAWEREGDVTDLEPFIEALARMDPGEDVDHVIGMTAALPRFSNAHDHLGHAWVLARHLVIRAVDDGLERQMLARAFPTLRRGELEGLHAARAEHKETAILIHEWAHTVGALHEDGRDLVMSRGYHHEASRLSEANVRVMSLAVASRGGDGEAASALRRHVAETEWEAWDPRERATLLEILAHGGSGRERAASPAAPARPAVAEALRAFEEHRAAGRLGDARAQLDEARGALGEDAAGWRRLARGYAAIGAYQRAEEALARAGGGAEVDGLRAQVTLMRRQRGVFGVSAEDEPEAAAAAEEAHRLLLADAAAARRALDRGLGRWPRHAGLHALRCGLELHAGKRAVAEAACKRALAVSDDSVLAHYFAGHAALRAGRRPSAMAHFERAIALDPDARVAYEGLAPLYRQAREADRLAELEAAYQARFGQSLR